MLEIILWLSIFLVFYAYFGYPLILAVIIFIKNRDVKIIQIYPRVSFIIAAYNEQKALREKLDNTISQSYPSELIEIIVSSDCSSDLTDEIAKSYESSGVKLVRALQRKGKEHAQKLAVDASSGEILVFSDVSVMLDPNGVASIVRSFSDPSVGCVSSVDKFIDKDGNISGEGAYVRYEMYLRSLETRANTLVGLSGSFFASRRELCKNWSTNLDSDFNTLLQSVKLGLRGVLDHDSIGYYANIADPKKEYERKIRTIVRGITAFMYNIDLLNPFRYGLFSWQLFSHKFCRWLVPFALIILIVANAFLVSSTVYQIIFLSQLSFYLLAFAGKHLTWLPGILRLPTFFVMVNYSIFVSWCRYVKGERIITWNPSERPS